MVCVALSSALIRYVQRIVDCPLNWFDHSHRCTVSKSKQGQSTMKQLLCLCSSTFDYVQSASHTPTYSPSHASASLAPIRWIIESVCGILSSTVIYNHFQFGLICWVPLLQFNLNRILLGNWRRNFIHYHLKRRQAESIDWGVAKELFVKWLRIGLNKFPR